MAIESKYDALAEYLKTRADPDLVMSFGEIEGLVGPLPSTASTPQFWANAEDFHRSRRQWLAVGYKAFLVKSGTELAVRFEKQVVAERSGQDWSDEELAACVRALR